MKQLIISLLLILVLPATGFAFATPAGDLNEDWTVNITDLKLFAAQWLTLPDCLGDPTCADLYDPSNGGRVDLQDLAYLMENWFMTAAPELIINEFMASNDTTIEDPDDAGDYPDWIEIYNYGTETVKMGGMTLVDDTPANSYTIPAGVTIDAGEHLLFWADGSTEEGQGPMHVGFKLGASGDQIHLHNKNGALIDNIAYSDNQLTDYSYGRYPDNDPSWYTMDSPTPGNPNNTGITSKIWFSKLSGPITSAFNLELFNETPGATIRYTTNGSAPTSGSTAYSGSISISITQSTRIRARAYHATLAPGPMQSHYYTPLASDVRDFSSSLPIVIIDTYGAGIDWGTFSTTYSTVFIDVDKNTGLASMQDIPNHAGRSGLHIRGESSTMYDKKQYALELWDEYNIDEKHSLLDMPSESDWILQAPYSDKTLMRNVLAFKWSNDIMKGFAAPGTKFVEVFLNTNGLCNYTDYHGIYVLAEKIKVSDNRVDIGKLTTSDNSEPEITGGYLLRLDKVSDGAETFQTSAAMVKTGWNDGFQFYDPSGTTTADPIGDLTGTQKTWLRDYLNEYETALNASDFDDPTTGYAKYIDVENFTETDAIFEIFKNADGLTFSTYLYKEKNGKISFGPMWDFNLSAGNTKDITESIGGTWEYPRYFAKTTTTDEGWFNQTKPAYGWHNRLLADPDYKLKTADKWFEHRQDKLSDAQITADIEYFYNLLTTNVTFASHPDNPAARNFDRWDILNTVQMCNYYYGNNPQFVYEDGNGSEPIPTAQREQGNMPHTYHMETEWLKNWFNGQGTPKYVSPIEYEWYRPEYTDRMGNLDAFWASDRNIDAPPTLSIDSSPMNIGGNVAPGSSLTMPVGTLYTTDGTDPRVWTHWDPGTGGVAPFTTWLLTESTSKKAIVPTAPISDNWRGGGSFNDSSWTSVSGGVGYERSSGYESHISYDVESLMYDDGSSGPFNETCYVRATFSVDSGDLADMDYVKLHIRFDDAFVAYINGTEVYRSAYVPGGTPAWDDGATDYPSESTSLVVIDISGYASELNAGSGNIIAIHGLNYGTGSSDFLISFELEIGSAGSGSSPTLITGGGQSPTALTYSSPITLNNTTQIKARTKNGSDWSALNEAVFSMNNVASSLRITEIMYNPTDPNDEFIEFKNIGSEDIDLALCELTKGVDFTFPSITLVPNAYTIIVRNQAHFEATYLAENSVSYPGSIAGEFLVDKLDNGGETIRLKDAAGDIIQEFDYEDGWFPVTDGDNFSLNMIEPISNDPNDWNKRLSWQASNVAGGTPGTAPTANVAVNDAVVINEILTHTDDLVEGDWIELYNTTGSSIDISGWYLSDKKDNLTRYKIPSPTWISSGNYLVLTSNNDFLFGLSEHGEEVFLTSGDGTDIAGGYSVGENFGSSKRDVTFGRHTKSDGNVDFVEMVSVTKGSANLAPYVSPVVISEIMYNPKDQHDSLGEYLELYNRTGLTVYLYDTSNPSNTWKFTKGIDFTFPTGVSIPPYDGLLISRALPALYIAANGDPGIPVYGPFENGTEMDNDGEKIELSMPTEPDPGTGFVSYIRLEQINYSDGTHPLGSDPWPASADGNGHGLERSPASDFNNYSNDVGNWYPASPTPGW